ncbi:MAG: nickel-responsive transcriptional regulator NikR [Myxococcota bacterium]|jgi:CopG family nickel-responsive transcriptional regulator|nr:nickel-responsive transcriptional regulator NikR [Myxococcota bacterium]
MSNLARFSISVESDLLEQFLALADKRSWRNRSEAIRDLMREALVREEWENDEEIVGTLTLVYDHHRRELGDRLTSIQHDHHELILSTLHVHLDHDNCLEVIAVRGRAAQVQQIADALLAVRGVKHGRLTATTLGRRI